MQADIKISDKVVLIKTDKDAHTGHQTLKGSRGVITNIPTFRDDVVDILFEGEKLPRCIFITDIEKVAEDDKISVTLIGENGNVFNLLGIVGREMKRAGLGDKFKELQTRAFASSSYDEVLTIIQEYVNVQ